jgi:SPP1 gp7 family putative phage head morphogenesis protein
MVHDYLRDHSITVSEKTRNRINKDIQEILTTSEKEGIGNKQVADKIKQKFNQLETWEARRIARTEINAANNLIAHNELLSNDLVDYKMWVATSDNRTRDTHRELNGEITRIGHTFSNGLQYPGDHNGELKEFINCR